MPTLDSLCKSVIVDEVDRDLLDWAWHISDAGYICGKGPGGRRVRLHRLILGRDLGRGLYQSERVDHVNGDRLDNRRCNLRLATNSQNGRNRGKNANNSSGYKGVYRVEHGRRQWQAKITHHRQIYYLGSYFTKEEAAAAYNGAARVLHGEYANLNRWEPEGT